MKRRYTHTRETFDQIHKNLSEAQLSFMRAVDSVSENKDPHDSLTKIHTAKATVKATLEYLQDKLDFAAEIEALEENIKKLEELQNHVEKHIKKNIAQREKQRAYELQIEKEQYEKIYDFLNKKIEQYSSQEQINLEKTLRLSPRKFKSDDYTPETDLTSPKPKKLVTHNFNRLQENTSLDPFKQRRMVEKIKNMIANYENAIQDDKKDTIISDIISELNENRLRHADESKWFVGLGKFNIDLIKVLPDELKNNLLAALEIESSEKLSKKNLNQALINWDHRYAIKINSIPEDDKFPPPFL